MRIVHLISGAGAMYCGSCLHANALATALHNIGADCVLAPVYTPVRTDDDTISIDRLGLGGINVYLQQRSAFFRRLPGFVLRLFDQPWLVRWATSRGTQTRPEELGEITLATFRGDEGPLKNEFDRLIDWLATDLRPDIVHLSNVMLAGIARPLIRRLNIPVVCTLSGEDTFLEKLPDRYRDEAKTILRERVKDLAALVALNQPYADIMASYLDIPRERVHVIRPGLRLAGVPPAKVPRLAHDGFTVGYFGRVLHDKGVHLLVDAIGQLNANTELPPARLRVAGYLDAADRGYLAQLERDAARLGFADRFESVGEVDRLQKHEFLQSLDAIALPSLLPESKGLPALEAWANGIPAVLANHGAFADLLTDTGGGLPFTPGNSADLTARLGQLQRSPDFAMELGRQGQKAVYERYNIEQTARDTLELYRKLCNHAGTSG